MASGILRKIRIIFASVILLSITLVFLDFRHFIPESWINVILWLQFVPSFLKFINLPSLVAAGFFIVLALTVFTGRSYCSILCPLGIFQDIVSRIGGKIKRGNRRFRYELPYNILRYSLLGVTMIVMLTGTLFLLTLLDPYSIFGRLMTYFGKPLLIQFNNALAAGFSKLDIYTIYKVQLKGIHAAAYALPVLFLVLVGYLSFKRGRLYCNTVCPVGTFLGFISKVSIFRIRIDSTSCTRCGRCSLACKASCIDFLNESVDVSRCVTCFNCIDSCNDNAISFSFKNGALQKSKEENVDKGKRNFILNTLALTASFAGVANGQDVPVPKQDVPDLKQDVTAPKKDVPVPKKESTVPEDKTSPVSPPGGISIDHFNDYCTACSLCVGACPTSVLRPSFRQYGLMGIMQPVMDYHKGFCNFECTVCIDVCPSGALLPLVLEAKKLTQLGKAKFIKKNCIVETERTDCGACSEHCPTKAVKMVPLEGNLVIPEVEEDICVGCGACEYACPTKPYKAIFVDGNPIHLDAKKPKEEASKLKELEEFPF